MLKKIYVEKWGLALVFNRDGELIKVLEEGKHRISRRNRVEMVSILEPVFIHKDLSRFILEDKLKGLGEYREVKAHERCLVYREDRFYKLMEGTSFFLWNCPLKTETEMVDARDVLFEHRDLEVILNSNDEVLDVYTVSEGHKGVFFHNSACVKTLEPGKYAFWKGQGKVKLYNKDMREMVLDVSGQDILSQDRVSLRLNAAVVYKIDNPLVCVLETENPAVSLYRDTQMILRDLVGRQDLDSLLSDREELTQKAEKLLSEKAERLGCKVISLGVKDIILPGEMKTLMNKVIEAKKASEANLIIRREEVAALRSQANSARMLENNPVLMRLKELELMEKLASKGNVSFVWDGKKLTGQPAGFMAD